MAQKLILPINDTRVTASSKTVAYLLRFGFAHYGVDMVSRSGNQTLYASGNGVVVAVGTDNVVGRTVVIRYYGAYNRTTGKYQDVIFRYFHLASIFVKAWQKVTKDTRIGYYGNTGSMKMGLHLHLEADTDTLYPLYSPTVKNSNFLRGRALGANDKTMSNPLDWMYCKTSAPDRQSLTGDNNLYVRVADRKLPSVV